MVDASGFPVATLRIGSLEEAFQKRPGIPPDVALTMLLKGIETELPADHPLTRAARVLSELREQAPRHEIQVADWGRGTTLLKDTPYTGEPVLHGSVADALRIAGDLFEGGLEVMLRRTSDGTLMIWVDDQRFSQR